MADPSKDAAESAERDADAAELYAPPAEDRLLPPQEAFPSRPSYLPAHLGFLAVLATSTVSSAIAGGLMFLWHEITPIKGGFLSGLEEFLLAFFGWAALSAFALLSGILLAAGILGRQGKVSSLGWTLTVVLAVLAALVCFIPEPRSTYALRGFFGLVAEVITVGLTVGVLQVTRRKYIGPPPPPEWMIP